ncbi:MAG: alpha/beta hydrolase [Anaerolineae bacterium]
MAFVEIDGKKLYYEVQGSGRALVLVHAAMMNTRFWDAQIEAFAAHFRVVCYDLYGYGQSAFTEQKKINHTADLKALLTHLGIETAAVVGVSMGAEMVLNFTLTYPQMVEAMVLVGSGVDGYDYPATGWEWWGDFVGAARAGDYPRAVELMTEHALEGHNAPLPPAVRVRIQDIARSYDFRHYADDTLLWAAPASDTPPAKRLGEIACPTLIMAGAQEHPLILEIAEFMTQRIKGAQKAIVGDAAHLVNLSQPEVFNRTVLAFLKQ